MLKMFQGLGQLDQKNADKFMKQLTGYSKEFGADQTALTDYVLGLQKAGFTFDEIQGKLKNSAKSIGIFNQSADSAVAFDKMSSRMKLTELQAEQLRKQVMSIGVATGDPEILNNLDEIQKTVAESTSFKGLSGKQAKEAILQTVKASALVRKTLKMNGEESAGFVTKIFENIKGTEEEFAKLRAGTGGGTEQFKELALAVGDSGKALDLINSNNTLGIIQAMRSSVAGLTKEEREARIVRLKGIFGPEFAELMSKNLAKTGKALEQNLANEKLIANSKTLADLEKVKLEGLEKFEEAKRSSLAFKQQELENAQNALAIQQEKDLIDTRLKAIQMQIKFNKSLEEAEGGTVKAFLRQFKALGKLNSMQAKVLGFMDLFGVSADRFPVLVDLMSGSLELVTENLLEIGIGYKVLQKPMNWFLDKTKVGKKMVEGFGKGMKFTKDVGKGFFGMLKNGPKFIGSMAKGLFNLGKSGLGFVTKGFRSTIGLIKTFGGMIPNLISKAGNLFGFLSKGSGVLKVVGGVFKKLFLPLGVVMALFDGVTKNWDNMTTAFKNGEWADGFIAILEMISDSINSFFLGIPKAIAGVINGLISGIFDDGDFWSNFKKEFAEGAKDIPFIGEKIHSALMGGGEEKEVAKDSKDLLKETAKSETNSSPVVQSIPLAPNSVINNNTNNNNTTNGDSGMMEQLYRLFNGGMQMTVVTQDSSGRKTGTQKTRLNFASNATSG